MARAGSYVGALYEDVPERVMKFPRENAEGNNPVLAAVSASGPAK